MSGPPPGYNENASALPGGGGDAPIMKVMGGGGMPDGYTNASLLAGGEGATITRVMGGGGEEMDGGGDTEVAAAQAVFDAADTALAAAPSDATLLAKKNNAETILQLEKNKTAIEKDLVKERTEKRKAEDKKTNLEGAKEVHEAELSRRRAAASAGTVAAAVGSNAVARVQSIIALLIENINAQQALIQAHAAKETSLVGKLANLDAQLLALRPAAIAPSAPAAIAPTAPSAPAAVPSVPAAKAVSTPTRNFQVEIYQIKLPDDLTKTLDNEIDRFNPTTDTRFPILVDKFIDRSVQKSKRYMTSSESNPQVPNKDGDGQADKIVHFINPTTTDTIIIIPPIKGDAKKFIMYMEYLSINDIIDEGENIVPGKVVLFMAPFFNNPTTLGASAATILGQSADDNNIKLLFSSLYFQEKNPESIHILQETELINSLDIGKSFYTKVPTLKNDAKNYLLNYLNPSYVILPGQAGTYPGLIFSSHAKLVKAKGTTFKSVEDLIKANKPGFSFNSNAATNESFNSYLTFFSNGDKSAVPIRTSSDKKCDSLITLFYDHEIKANPFTLKLDNEIMFIRFGNKQPPLICSDLKSGELHEGIPESGPFKGSDTLAVFAKADTLTVEIDGVIREFRIPTHEKTDKVRANWKAGIYSEKEAEFLNDLNLTPEVLSVLVGKGRMWKEDVDKFLFNLVTSKCFTDKDILTRAPCDDTREFLNKIYDYFYYHTMDRMKDKKQGFELRELHIPKSDIISWPSELGSEGDGKQQPTGTGAAGILDGTTSFQHVLVIHRTSGDYKYMKLVIDKPKGIVEGYTRNLHFVDTGLNSVIGIASSGEKMKPLYIQAIDAVNKYKTAVNHMITEISNAPTVADAVTEADVVILPVNHATQEIDSATREINNNTDVRSELKLAWSYIAEKAKMYDFQNDRLLGELIAEFKDVYHEFVFIPL